MKQLLINLDRSPERLGRMTIVLDRLGLEFQRISAVDGKLLSAEEIYHWRPGMKTSPGPARPGETACFLSHRKCWQTIVDEALPYAVVLEDDLHFTNEASTLLSTSDWIPKDADIVKIETKLYPTLLAKSAAAKVSGHSIFRLRGKHAGAGGYVVSHQAAVRLLEMSNTIDSPVDQFLFNPALPSCASLAIYQLFPAICIQDFVVKDGNMILGLGSDLHDERRNNGPRGAAKLIREIKRPVHRLAVFLQRGIVSTFTRSRWTSIPFG